MIANQPFHLLQQEAQTDREGCIHLGQNAKAKRYRILINDAGQILLDPIDNVPERESWLWQNADALAAVHRGIEQVEAGQQRSLGSFAQFADLEIED